MSLLDIILIPISKSNSRLCENNFIFKLRCEFFSNYSTFTATELTDLLINVQVPSLVQDVRRAVASSVLSIMMDKTPSEKIIDSILKVIKELIVHHTEEVGF